MLFPYIFTCSSQDFSFILLLWYALYCAINSGAKTRKSVLFVKMSLNSSLLLFFIFFLLFPLPCSFGVLSRLLFYFVFRGIGGKKQGEKVKKDKERSEVAKSCSFKKVKRRAKVWLSGGL
jgi:predicted membrane protein